MSQTEKERCPVRFRYAKHSDEPLKREPVGSLLLCLAKAEFAGQGLLTQQYTNMMNLKFRFPRFRDAGSMRKEVSYI